MQLPRFTNAYAMCTCLFVEQTPHFPIYDTIFPYLGHSISRPRTVLPPCNMNIVRLLN